MIIEINLEIKGNHEKYASDLPGAAELGAMTEDCKFTKFTKLPGCFCTLKLLTYSSDL